MPLCPVNHKYFSVLVFILANLEADSKNINYRKKFYTNCLVVKVTFIRDNLNDVMPENTFIYFLERTQRVVCDSTRLIVA